MTSKERQEVRYLRRKAKNNNITNERISELEELLAPAQNDDTEEGN